MSTTTTQSPTIGEAPALELENACVGFGPSSARHEVLSKVNLRVAPGEFVAVLGFSGSGKSTLISLLAGLTVPDSGTVRLNGRVNPLPGPERGIMFQNYSLLPWLTVFGNVEIAVRQVFPRLSPKQRREHVQRYLDMVSLSGSEEKRPAQLSGGMRQRLSLARTLAMRPDVLLLDEPLSALDALTRSVLQDEILRIWDEDRRTVVMITNDVDEAVLMADRIIPLKPGPEATLVQDFPVTLERPRDRTTLNFDPRFKKLRNEITRTMIELNQETKAHATETLPAPPTIRPIRLNAAS
ncbi:MAG: ABC transporter ATP-binding protein [Pirellulaceae bacterium]